MDGYPKTPHWNCLSSGEWVYFQGKQLYYFFLTPFPKGDNSYREELLQASYFL